MAKPTASGELRNLCKMLNIEIDRRETAKKKYKVKAHTIRLKDNPQLHGVLTIQSLDEKNSNPHDDFWYVFWNDKCIAKIYEAELFILALELIKMASKRNQDIHAEIRRITKERPWVRTKNQKP